MENIAGLRDEAFMSAPNDYLQRVKFQFSGYNRVKSNGYTTEVDSRTQYTNTWGKLARELWEDRGFGQAISRGASGAAAVQTAWNGAPDPYTKMKAIHAFVRSQFSWNHLYAIEAYEGLKNVWERRSGTNGEINLLLIALLKDAGLDVTPLLVSEHDHGKVDTTYPYRSQFNNVVAYVRLDNAHYILDGTDAQTPTYMIPFSLLNTTAFLVTKKDPSFITITDAGKKNLTLVNLSGTLSNEGAMQLQAQADLYDYAKADKRLAYRRDKKEYEKSFLYQFEPGMIDSFAVTGADADTLALHHDAALHYTLERTGDFALLRYNFFTGFTYNPFLPDQRFTDVDYGCAYTCILNAVFTLPDHLEPENLPKNVRLLLPDKTMSVTRQMQLTDNILRIGIRIEISKTAYSLETYPELQSFYKGLIDLLNEPVLLKPTK